MEGCHGAIRRGASRTVTTNRGLAEAMARTGSGRERLSRDWGLRLRAFGRGSGPTGIGCRVAFRSARTTAVGPTTLSPPARRFASAGTVGTPLPRQELTG